MVLTIFGASGRTGLRVVKRAIAAGHTIKAAVRNLEAFGETLGDDVNRTAVVKTDVLDSERVARAVAGSDAVVSVIGPRKDTPNDMLGRGGRNIVAAMHEHDVRRVIALTGAGVRFPQDRPGLVDTFIRFLLKTLQPDLLEDSMRYAESFTESDLDWTIVRAPMLYDKPAPGPYRVGYVGTNTGARASRDNIARFIIDEITGNHHIGDAPVVSD